MREEKKDTSKVTIKTIANEMGVSFSTVSKALNNSPLVKPETRQAVLKKAAELNYTPNVMARSLREKGTNTIAIIMNDTVNSVISTMINGISHAMNQLGYLVIYCDPQFSSEQELHSIRYALARRPDYVLYAPSDAGMKNLELFSAVYDRLILFHTPIPEIECNYICVDYAQGGYLAASAMFEAGHRNIQVITQPDTYPISRLFLSGVRRAFEQYQIPFIPEHILFNKVTSVACGDELMESLWDASAGKYCRPFTGIITFCDVIAHGVYRNLFSHGFRIPEDFSVIGFDDNPFNEFSNPPLSTVKLPGSEMTDACIQILTQNITGAHPKPRTCYITPSYVSRASVAAPKSR